MNTMPPQAVFAISFKTPHVYIEDLSLEKFFYLYRYQAIEMS
jgi:hypothetical protein